MSYLLKAMKKAEQERQALQDAPVSTVETKVVSAGLPLPIVGVVLFVCAVVLAQVMFTGESEKAKDAVYSEELSGNEVVAVKDTVKPIINVASEKKVVPAKPEQVDEFSGFEVIRPNDSNAQTFESIEPQSVSVEPQEFKEPEPKQLEQLSKAELNTIPSMQLESHIYSSAKDFRSVVINGRTFHQGDYFSPDVVLHQITEDGVVIQVNGQLLALPKGISWVASNGQ